MVNRYLWLGLVGWALITDLVERSHWVAGGIRHLVTFILPEDWIKLTCRRTLPTVYLQHILHIFCWFFSCSETSILQEAIPKFIGFQIKLVCLVRMLSSSRQFRSWFSSTVASGSEFWFFLFYRIALEIRGQGLALRLTLWWLLFTVFKLGKCRKTRFLKIGLRLRQR